MESTGWSLLYEVVAGSFINFLDQTHNIFLLLLMVGLNLLTNRQLHAVNFLLPETG